MIVSELVTEIRNRSGDANITETSVTGWTNTATRLVSTRTDWPFLLMTDDTDTTTSGTVEYTLPTDFRKMFSFRVGSSTSTEPEADEYSFIGYMEKNKAVNSISDSIAGYYINPTNSKYGIVPEPTTTGDKVYQKYYKHPTTVSAVSATPELPTTYHDIYLDFGLARYWEQEDELDKTVLYETKVENGIEAMKTEFVKSIGQLSRMRDVRELNTLNHPQGLNSVMTGRQ